MEPPKKKRKNNSKWARCGLVTVFERPYTPHGIGLHVTAAQEEAITSFIITINQLKIQFFEDWRKMIGQQKLSFEEFNNTFCLIEDYVKKEKSIQETQKSLPLQVYLPKGLANFGNTCFFNAAVQVFLGLGIVRAHFKNYHGNDEIGTGLSTIINSEKWGHKMLYDTMQKKYPVFFRKGAEGDAQEMLSAMFQEVENFDSLFVEENFRHVSTNRCLKCGASSTCADTFLAINLRGEVKSVLSRFASPRDEYCQRCRSQKPHTFGIQKIGSVLCFHMLRFDWMGKTTTKIDGHVQFPSVLDVGPYMRDAGGVWKYALKGVIEHVGPITSSGHYISFVKSSDSWYQINDDIVQPTTQDRVLGSCAYVLVYQRMTWEFLD